MLEARWTYSKPTGLTQWYGHVDYYGPYVIGQWFVLDSETGKEHWSRRFLRANTIRGFSNDVIVASETRSDGPWTFDFGLYGISAKTGGLLWVNHGRGLWGKLLRCIDHIPGITNQFRDAPQCVIDEHVVTKRGRTIDIRTGHDRPSLSLQCPQAGNRSRPEELLYDNKWLPLGDHQIDIEGHGQGFLVRRRDANKDEIWRFSAKEHSKYVDGNYYSYRLHGNHILAILGDAPKSVPINAAKPFYHKPNPANYQLGIINLASGDCEILPLINAEQRTECRIETVRDSRLLISCDGVDLAEYDIEI